SGSLKVSPNPVTDKVMVRYQNESEGALSVNLYDLTGRMLLSLPLGNQAKGEVTATFNMSTLTPGTYVVRMGTGFAKIVKQ
ncbi:MAG TPA: T9SS type A sorting domain-containing protein, partial [Bacteroidales bacterium]|nr:T9SS type A sorting domain-containing protein [Bacteroidales bacterium]